MNIRTLAILGAEATLLWAAWIAVQLGYVYVRAVGDDLWQPHDVRAIEEFLFFGSPAHAWQQAMAPQDFRWLSEIGRLFHGFWFGVPFAYGFIVMRYDRERLFSYLVWTTAVSYACALVFAMFPVRPPWMDGDLSRVLIEGGITDYTGLDNNPAAAFPSMHAALPMAIALFAFFGSTQIPRFFAWLVLAFSIGVGASVVYLGEHWLVDVLAGYAFAGGIAYAFTRPAIREWLDKPWWRRGEARQTPAVASAPERRRTAA